ncbi:MAG TPA: F0F1 ATP synthase subunit gamma [Gammaproteobacteria bacterium]|nr:F0F1 ATP synthase subunit gamma [Gammaproteobacteria bacterium]
MAGAKEIRGKISSIQNTRKITKAMEMVAASKMRRAQEQMKATRPYAEKMRVVIHHMARAHPEYRHPYVMHREQPKRAGFIVVTSDRGLCGGLNTNLFRTLLTSMQEWDSDGNGVDISVFGKKGVQFFSHTGGNMVSQLRNLADKPELANLIGSIKVMLSAYDEGRIDRLFVVSNEFVNTMTQRPRVEQLLPITPEKSETQLAHHWDYLYEPDARDVVDTLMTRYIESLVYQSVVENIACEQAARMVAMKSASDNAGNIIDELQLVYNKARQAAITQEISEIVGGAAAV